MNPNNANSSNRGRRFNNRQANALQSDQATLVDDTYWVAEEEDDSDYLVHSFTAYSITGNTSKDDKFFTWLPITVGTNRTVKVLIQVDSAATCNTLPSTIYDKLGCSDKLQRSNARIMPYSGGVIRPKGKLTLTCEGTNSFEILDFEVISADDIPGKPALLSGKDSQRLGLIQFHKDRVFASSTANIQTPGPEHVHSASNTGITQKPGKTTPGTDELVPGKIRLNDLLTVFKGNFEGLGNIGKAVHLKMDSDVTPVHAGIHRIPVAKMASVKLKLDEMVRDKKLEKVETPTDWCSNMTVREKLRADGSTKVRLCMDPSQTINKAIVIPHYQIPTTAEMLPQLSGKKFKTFSIFDALDGFTQIELDEESKDLTTMHTPWGRYRWCRLPYGISCAPEEFQMRMHEAIEGLEGVFNIADDVFVVGQGDTREEADMIHDQNVLALMHRAVEKNIKWNGPKTQFKLPKINFMGAIYSEAGVLPDTGKMKAIREMPIPDDKKAVTRFCGMANYLSNFCPNLSQVIKPLYDLSRINQEFIWSSVHQKAFDKAKTLITQAPCLAYFDPNKPVTLQVDASQGGLGGAILQPNEDDKLQPVAYTSCRMRPNEENWAQIEKECLAIVSACDKWDLWIYGMTVTIHTDHQPLETIFKKPLRAAPRRLQKMMMRLQRYKLNIVYKKGSSLLLADTLSRAPLPTTNNSKETNFEVFRLNLEAEPVEKVGITSQTLTETRTATANDPVLQKLSKVVTTGWPDLKSQLPPELAPYWTFRDELTVQDNIVHNGLQILIPASMRNNMLKKIHAAHLGPESNIRMCKDFLFWPGMKADIRDMCNACSKCAQFKAINPKEPMQSQPIPERPWQFVSQDLATFETGNYLITVDHFSDFVEVDELDNTLSSTIASKTESHIARYGAFDIVLTDNGPQFIGSEYEGLCDRYSIQHITSSPYWPQGNGKAEASVKIIKNLMKKCGKGNLQGALLAQRNTPPQGHDLSPAQRCMGRRTKGLLPMSNQHLEPTGLDQRQVQNAIAKKRQAAKIQYDHHITNTPLRPLQIGDFVYTKPPPHRKSGPWDYGLISEIPTTRSYIVETPNGVTRRNRGHIRPAAPPPAEALVPRSWSKHLVPRDYQTKTRPIDNQPIALANPRGVEVIMSPVTNQDRDTATTRTPRSSAGQNGRDSDIQPSVNLPPTVTRSGRVVKPVTKLDL